MLSSKGYLKKTIILLTALLQLMFYSVGHAGVTLDGTMGTKGTVNGPDYTITSGMGKQVGGNLFQSFSVFNINTGESATFTGPGSVQNVISRVTGGSASNIDGALRCTIPGADFYFINPAGVMFGPNATLDVSGSFHVSTADYIKLADGGRFDATNPSDSLLTSAPLSAFGFLSDSPKGISINSSFLEVPAGQTISLVGGDINILRGTLYAPGGTINLISAASQGEAVINGNNFSVEGFGKMGQISVTDTRLDSERPVNDAGYVIGNVDVSDAGGGNVYIRGGQFVMDKGYIFADTFGDTDGRGIDIHITGESNLGNSAFITTDTFGKGNAGNIFIETGNLSLSNVGRISSNTYEGGEGAAGNVTIKASDSVYISDYYDSGEGVDGSGISSDTFGKGKAGNIYIETGKLSLLKTGYISTSSHEGSEGDAGDITIKASDSVSVSDYYDDGEDVYVSRISSDTFGKGKAGNISIETGNLSLSNLGTVSTFAYPGSEGDAGNVIINAAGAISIADYYDNGQGGFYQSEIISETYGPGKAGNISITSESLSLANGGEISTSARELSTGDAGNITVNATGAIYISGYYDDGQGNVYQSGIFTDTFYKGSAGDITIETGTLSITEGGSVSSSAFEDSKGNAGNITIKANSAVSISGYYDDGQGNVYQSGIFTDTFYKGSAGDITIETGTLSITNAGSVSSSAFEDSKGNAGNITIKANNAVNISGYHDDGQGNVYQSGIFTDTFYKGNAGDITIETGTLSITNAGSVSSSAFENSEGNAGDIAIKVNNAVNISGDYADGQGTIYQSGIFSDTSGKDNAGDITIETGTLSITEGGSVSSSAFENSEGNAGDIAIKANNAVNISGYYDDGQGNVYQSGIFTDTSGKGNAGDITIETGTLSITEGGSVSSSAFEDSEGKAGNITIKANNAVNISGYYDDGQGNAYSSSISSETLCSGTGGHISIYSQDVDLTNKGLITVVSTATGTAGNITINANDSIKLQDSSITAATENADGGNIQIQADNMLHLIDSDITATVKGGTGNGGNIATDTVFVILDNSKVIANADRGNGGNILINAKVYLASPDSIVSASSKLGLSGTVDISAPLIDISGNLAVLPSSYLDVNALLPKQCKEREEEMSSFVVRGRDGIPPQPDSLLMSPMISTVKASAVSKADEYMRKMEVYMQTGDYRQALISGTEAERLYRENGDVGGQIKVRIQMSTAYQNLGQYKKGLEYLKFALDLSGKSTDEDLLASLQSHIGNAYLLLNQFEEAETYLKKGLDLADKVNNFEAKASALNNLGNLYVLRMSYEKAGAVYKESIALAEKTGNLLLSGRAMANSAKALFLGENYRDAENLLNSAYKRHIGLTDSHDKAYGLINIARIYRQLFLVSSPPRPDLKSLAATVMRKAVATAEGINDHLSASYSLGYLGQAYEDEGLYTDAMDFTRRAVFEAQQVNAPESLYLWQWQNGRVLNKQERSDEAIAAYRSAVQTLQTIRQELLGDCKVYNQISFGEAVEPVYLGLVDLLLRRYDSVSDRGTKEMYLVEARRTIELTKTAELQDYFQNACVVANQSDLKRLDTIPASTASIYVIPFPDRLELLLASPAGIRKFTVQVKKDKLAETVRLFRQRLEKRTTREYLEYAQRLYEWLVRPVEAELQTQKIDTIVFILDGPLRTIPLSALHDGKEFLINKYALATTPGISLTDSQAGPKKRYEILLTGLSKPVQGFAALRNVPFELNTIRELFKGELLQDEDFLAPMMRKELENTPYSIVHMASHGEFSHDISKTFILTWDERLTMDDLEKFIGISRFRREPLALLTLSACRSAAGDDRAALGLAGVAVKAGAGSALATLWYVNDQATSELVTEFYKQLKKGSLSKAKVLQRAQLRLIGNRQYEHPYYWAPFLLIGNWL